MRAPRLAALLLCASLPAAAVQPDEVLPDPALEARAREISKGLRCPVCRNESIDDSNAEIARDLRILVRERLLAGDSDAAVVTAVVDRYGEYVLLRPSLSAGNLALWLAGPLLLGGGLFLARGLFRRRSRPEEAQPLDAAEEARLAALLKDGP